MSEFYGMWIISVRCWKKWVMTEWDRKEEHVVIIIGLWDRQEDCCSSVAENLGGEGIPPGNAELSM